LLDLPMCYILNLGVSRFVLLCMCTSRLVSAAVYTICTLHTSNQRRGGCNTYRPPPPRTARSPFAVPIRGSGARPSVAIITRFRGQGRLEHSTDFTQRRHKLRARPPPNTFLKNAATGFRNRAMNWCYKQRLGDWRGRRTREARKE
jgi:hypothetical protein